MLRALAGGLGALLLFWFSSAAAAPGLIVNPDWLEMPSGDDLARQYPNLAARLGLPGRATISCVVAASGELIDCRVVQEAPLGLGFGQAAQAMAPIFRMRPKLRDGTPVSGGTVLIPIRFILPEEPPTAASEDAVKKAGSAPPAALTAASLLKGSNALGVKESAEVAPLSDAKIQADGEAALQEAEAAVLSEMTVAVAEVLAARFDEAELQDLSTFLASPAGASLLTAWPSTELSRREASKAYFRRVLLETRLKTCAQIACPVNSPATLANPLKDLRTLLADETIPSPAILASPNFREVLHASPKLAMTMGVDGLVVLRCPVSTEGVANDCAVLYENLPGWGFGAAAQGLATRYRFAPGPVDMGIGGRRALVPILFPNGALTANLAPAATTSRPSARATAILTDVLHLKSQDELTAAAAPEIKQHLDMLDQPGVDAKKLNAYENAFRSAAIRFLPEFTDDYVSIFAASFSDAEL